MGFYIYLYNVLFLCLFACAAFYCGVVRSVTDNRHFGFLSALMVLLALEGVADMGAAIIDSNFSSGLFTGASVGLSPLDIAKLIFQLGEEAVFYLLACGLDGLSPRVLPFIAFPLVALARCVAGMVGGSVACDLLYLLADPAIIAGLSVWTLKGMAGKSGDEIYRCRFVQITIFMCLCAYLGSIAESVIYAVLYVTRGSAPFFVGKISIFEDLLWAGLSVACIVYARSYQDHVMLKRTELLVNDRLDMYRLEMERRESEERAGDIAGFCALYELTPREQEVLARVLGGCANQEIADELSISLGTVKTHVHSIYRKLAVSRRSELMGMFYERSHAGPGRE